MSERCRSCRYFEDATCFVLPPIRLPRKFAPAGDRTRDETLIWGRPPVNATDLACEKHALPRNERVLADRLNLFERYVASVAMWMERENVTDQERLSYIKGHPVTRAAARAKPDRGRE